MPMFCDIWPTPKLKQVVSMNDVVDEWNILPLMVLCVAYHLLATWTYGLSVSNGVFVPLLLIGALWGRVIGMLVMAVWPAAVCVAIHHQH